MQEHELNQDTDDSVRAGILQAAGDLFREQGYEGTSLRAIAEKSGVLLGSLFYRFRTKDAILAELMTHGMETAIKRLGEALQNAPPGERLKIAIAEHIRLMLSNDQAIYVLLYEWKSLPRTRRGQIIPLRDQYEQLWEKILRDYTWQEGIDIGVLRRLIIGALNWTPNWMNETDRSNADEIAKMLILALNFREV